MINRLIFTNEDAKSDANKDVFFEETSLTQGGCDDIG